MLNFVTYIKIYHNPKENDSKFSIKLINISQKNMLKSNYFNTNANSYTWQRFGSTQNENNIRSKLTFKLNN